MLPLKRIFVLLVFALPAHAQTQTWGWDDGTVPYVQTPMEIVERMLRMAEVKPGDHVIDLGSGDGRIVIEAAKRGATAMGVDLDPNLVKLATENAQAAGVEKKVVFKAMDLFDADLSPASVVTLYLLPGLIGKLQPRFIYELRPGTRIVAHAFGMAGWKPDRTETLRIAEPHPGQGPESKLYLWIVPAEVRGVWRGGGHELRIEQNYQQIEVEGARQARLSGRDISWQLGEVRFAGVVEGDRMAGELAAPDGRRQALVLLRVRP